MSIDSAMLIAAAGLATDDDSTGRGSAILGDKKHPHTSEGLILSEISTQHYNQEFTAMNLFIVTMVFCYVSIFNLEKVQHS